VTIREQNHCVIADAALFRLGQQGAQLTLRQKLQRLVASNHRFSPVPNVAI
jgi:hypothetical protein